MKYNVYATYSVSKLIGQFEADSHDEAIEFAECSEDFQCEIGLCWRCSENVGESAVVHYKTTAEEAVWGSMTELE